MGYPDGIQITQMPSQLEMSFPPSGHSYHLYPSCYSYESYEKAYPPHEHPYSTEIEEQQLNEWTQHQFPNTRSIKES